jgi:hypothetical protein
MKADEGMWLMMLVKRLNGVDLQKKDCTLHQKKFILLTTLALKTASFNLVVDVLPK